MKRTHNPPVLGSSPSRPTGNGFLTGCGFQPASTLSERVRFAGFHGLSGHLMAVITAGTSAADEIRRLPAALTVVQAARLLGIGRSSAYQAVKSGAWPARVLRVGRTIRIPSAEVLALLGIGTDEMRGSQH